MSVDCEGMVIGHGWWSGASCAGKSAVQLLQESKSRYVKSDRVLVTRQELPRPDLLHISTNPNIFLSAPSHTLHVSRSCNEAGIDSSNKTSLPQDSLNVAPLTSLSLALHSGPQSCLSPFQLGRNSRGASRPRPKTQPVGDAVPRHGDLRRSLSHGPADRTNDIQMKLRELLNSDSKEGLNLIPENKRNCRSIIKNQRYSRASSNIHKSLPELCHPKNTSERRPSCPGVIEVEKVGISERELGSIHLLNTPPPPPRPPRKSSHSVPEMPAKVPPRPPPPKLRHYFHEKEISANPNEVSYSAACDWTDGNPPFEFPRRPILRSKSDVSHERLAYHKLEEDSFCDEELEYFFNSMGLDCGTLQEMECWTYSGTSPIYFEDVLSTESGPIHRPGSSGSDTSSPGLWSQEPSIIEKNARVIKWLFNCQKAKSLALPRSLSSGS